MACISLTRPASLLGSMTSAEILTRQAPQKTKRAMQSGAEGGGIVDDIFEPAKGQHINIM